jgi:hypothetical protein
MFASANKNKFHTNKYFMILCYKSFILKILIFIKMNLSCLKIPRKRKEKIKYLVLFNKEFLSPACTHTTCKYSLPQIIDVIIILFYYYIHALMDNIILINCLSISFQIHVVIFFVSIINNVKSLYFYPNLHSNMQQSKKFRPFLNIMYVKCINMITLHVIPSVNLHT